MITIELREHAGITDTDFGPRKEVLDQWMVLAKDDAMGGQPMFMGYLPVRENAPFLPCIPFVEQPRVIQAEIVDALCKHVGRPVHVGVVPILPEDWYPPTEQEEGENDGIDEE